MQLTTKARVEVCLGTYSGFTAMNALLLATNLHTGFDT